MNRPSARILLVEGQEDLRVIPYLVEAAGVEWGPKNNPIVRIEQYNGVDDLLAPGAIEAQLKASGLTALGVVVDADESAPKRWAAIRARIEHRYPHAPNDPPLGGCVLHDDNNVAFGAWIMPDNASHGMLETFLLHLRPKENAPLLDLATTSVAEARTRGAPFRLAHEDKALIHSWLAWQDPPGRQLHNAIMEKMLTEQPQCLFDFVDWFCHLFGVARIGSP